ncbi:MAG: hypothetical protein R3191_02915 [Anaerolineales bacterium]|nr:hypothetical protein [Anaerolineales bacterium]
MRAERQSLPEGERAERPSSARLRILTFRMILAILVSPWFIVGYVWGFIGVLSRSMGVIGGSGLNGWELIAMFSLMAIGPTAISLSLSPSWRGGLAAFIASSVLIIAFLPVGGMLGMVINPILERHLSSLVSTPIGPPILVAIIGAIPILIALPLTGYVNGGQGLLDYS